MKIAILGAGNGGCAVAADLSYRGHEVTLIKTSHAMHDDNFNYLIENNGHIQIDDFGDSGCMNPTDGNRFVKDCFIAHITRDISQLTAAEVVIIYIQTNYHEVLIQKMAPHICHGQIVVINPGYFSTAYALRHWSDKDISIVEAQSSFIDCRISKPGTIRVGFRNARNPLGVYPARNVEEVKSKLDLLGFPFVYNSNIVSAALHNPNMIVHTVGAVMSIPMIDTEGANFCMYHSAFTEHVWNILESLDAEKMNVLEFLGCERLSYVEACKFRNTLNDSEDAKQVFFEYAAMPTRAKAPSKVNSRYITEDVPQGLVMLESLGQYLGVSTPVCSALINLSVASLGIDFRTIGRSLERLGLDMIKKILQDGRSSLNKA